MVESVPNGEIVRSLERKEPLPRQGLLVSSFLAASASGPTLLGWALADLDSL